LLKTAPIFVPVLSHKKPFHDLPSYLKISLILSSHIGLGFPSVILSFRFFHQNPVYPRTNSKSKGKAVPLQAWSGPEGSRKLRFPDYLTTAQGGGKVVSLTHRPPLPLGNAPGTHRGCVDSRVIVQTEGFYETFQ